MKLKDLLECEYANDEEVYGICTDTRSLKCGEVFFALHGSNTSGENFAEDAIQKGAIAVVGENLPRKKGFLNTKNVKATFKRCVNKLYGSPEEGVILVGITGTNGKTTTSHMIADILNFSGIESGIIGTLGAKWQGKSIEFSNTTPGYVDFAKAVKMMKDDGVECIICEVSAHAIDQDRLEGLQFDIGVFTNLTQDHLDYFENMTRYGEAKKKFFKDYCKSCVVNADDTLGGEISMENPTKALTYGIYNPSDVFGIDREEGDFIVNVMDEIYSLQPPLVGEFNKYNLIGAISVCRLLGVRGRMLERAVSAVRQVPGRFNVYKGKKTVIIDYAHTPDGFENVLKEGRKITDGDIICVFGCGGDRDKSKRPIMGAIAEKYADITVLTEDNSRSESTIDIIRDIRQGMLRPPVVIESRKEATRYAINLAKESDLVLILGKGAENYIEKEGRRVPYSDTNEVKSLLADT